MAAITFSEIMNYYPDNQMVYDQIKQEYGKFIPFVGAGLSVPCYPLWPKALKELAEQVAVPETKNTIVDMIEGENPQLLEAAQALEDYWGHRGMAAHLLKLFSAAKIQKHREKLPHQSVWLLPQLFPGKPAVTTNFDRVLETVYIMQGYQFDREILPGCQNLQDQLRQGERHGLLKLHGDIGSETLDYSSIIFGKRQYQEAYQKGQPIEGELEKWFSNKMLLFLGCSLKADAYLDLLQEVAKPESGVTHYAILECEDVRDAAARSKQLGDQWGIQALFYPKGRHEAVRVILEKLLEDHNPTAYQALPTHVGALPDQSPSSRFHYKSGAVSFHGRQEELEQLRKFCGQEDVAFRWWAVTGAGGAGKSRLVYEFEREMKGSGWNVLWINSTHMDQLESLHIPTKTLVVVDYAQAYLGPLGHWMEQLAQRHHLVPVRLLLLERDGTSLDESSWGSGLRAEVGRVTLVRRSCWREPFLQLTPLQEKELLGIMTDYATKAGKCLEEEKAQQLLETLKITDSELRRPLYAMFLTDAWANGEEPEQWGQKAVLDYVLKRENEYFEEKLGPKLYDLSEVFCQLRLVATIWDGITPEQVAQEYPQLWSEFQVQANTSNSAKMEKKLLRQVGLLQGTELAGLKPDLLGEYFVLQHLNKPEVLQLLFPDGWQSKMEILVFLHRLYLDYKNVLENIKGFWRYMIQWPSNSIDVYGKLIVNVTAFSSKYIGRAVDILRRLWEKRKNQASNARWYAKGLFNLSNAQTARDAEKTMRQLEELSEAYYGNIEIALVCAKGLFNLSNKQVVSDALETMNRLGKLHMRYPHSAEISLVYAMGLFNLSNKQAVEGTRESLRKLEVLCDRHVGNQKLASEYGKGLYDLSNKETEEREIRKIIERLGELYQKYPDNVEITLHYVYGLLHLTALQTKNGVGDSLCRIEELYRKYPYDEKIAIAYAQGLVNLACDQTLEDAKRTISHLRKLSGEHPKNQEINFWYTRGEFNLAKKEMME